MDDHLDFLLVPLTGLYLIISSNIGWIAINNIRDIHGTHRSIYAFNPLTFPGDPSMGQKLNLFITSTMLLKKITFPLVGL